MIVATAVLLYDYSRQRLLVDPNINFLGFSFPVTFFELDVVFLVLIAYSAFRYTYLAFIQSTPPWSIRASLLRGELPSEFFLSEGDIESTSVLHLIRQANRYFPYENVEVRHKDSDKPITPAGRLHISEKTRIVLPNRSWKNWNTWKTAFWCSYENTHYALPLLLSLGGIVWLIYHMIYNPEPAAKLMLPPL